jgi:hypothetical protein
LILAVSCSGGAAFGQHSVEETVAEEEPGEDLTLDGSSDLLLTFSPYFWAIGLDGTVGIGPSEADVSLGFSDILDGSDDVFGVMGRLSVRAKRGSAYFDTTYARVDFNNLGTRVGPIRVAGDLTFKISWIEAGASHVVFSNTEDPKGLQLTPGATRIGVSAGIRYTRISTDVDLSAPVSLGLSPTEAWADPIIGIRGAHAIGRRTMLGFEGDVGGFGIGTDFTWSAMGVIGQRFTLGNASAFWYLGYRAIGQDYESGSGANTFKWDVVSHGMLLGLTFAF